MKKFLYVLAKPFIALWTWIKETAWVQPLLIVGAIFAIIFSIPYIVSGIQGLSSGDDTMEYYEDNMISMKGAYNNSSEANEFLSAYNQAQTSWQIVHDADTTQNVEEAQQRVDNFVSTYGEKFFFVFASNDCEACDNMSNALEYLEDNQETLGISGYSLKAIITDEDMDDEEDEYKEESAFTKIYNTEIQYFENLLTAGTRNAYYGNLTDPSSFKNSLTNFLKGPDSVEVPIITIVDLSENNTSNYITTQVFFSVNGDTDGLRAIQLADAWNYTGQIFGNN